MAFGDSLNWMACPPVIRKRVRNYVLAALLACAAGIGLVVFRDPLGIPYEPWGRYGPLVFALMPILVFWPMFLLGRRRFFRVFKEAGGRLCTHCAYNLSPMGESGTCPECGKPHDAKADKAMWEVAGYTIAE
jgi:hypothetical protein